MVPTSAPRRVLRVLVRPRTALGEDPPDAVTGVLVVALAGLLVAVSVAASGILLGAVVPGTATIGNPERPPPDQCTEPDGWPDDMEWHTPSECTVPERVDVNLGAAAQQHLFGAAIGAPFALGLLWLAVGGAGYLLGAGESFGHTLGRAAWAFVPIALLWPVRAATVALRAATWSFPDTPTLVRESTVNYVFGTADPTLLAVSLVGFGWASYVLVGAFASESGSLGRGALAAAPLFGFGLVALTGSPLSLLGGADEALPAILLFLGLFGLPLLLVPREWIELQKRFELVDFRNTREVEPSDWYVALHRLGGLLVVGGAAVFVGAGRYLV